jgi:long-subunit fatty acid transport protein
VVTARMNWWHSQVALDDQNNGVLIQSRFETRGHGVGFSVGGLWKISSRIQLGARYRHGASFSLPGKKTLTQFSGLRPVTIDDPLNFPMNLSKGRGIYPVCKIASSRITLPGDAAVGFLIVPFKRLSFEIDLNWRSWSRFDDWMFRNVKWEFEINRDIIEQFEDAYGNPPEIISSDGLALDWRDTLSLKIGANFRVTRHLSVSSGFTRDPSAIGAKTLSPITPDIDRDILSLGLSYEGPLFSLFSDQEMSGLSFDCFFRYALSQRRRSELSGFEYTYDSKCWVLGFSAGLNL